jgi:hypothetical protein
MKDLNEEKLTSLLAPRRSEAFWAGQKARIMSASREKRALPRAWLAVPALAAVALLLLVPGRAPRQPAADTDAAVTTAFLEHLDFLADMDVLEAVPEEEL